MSGPGRHHEGTAPRPLGAARRYESPRLPSEPGAGLAEPSAGRGLRRASPGAVRRDPASAGLLAPRKSLPDSVVRRKPPSAVRPGLPPGDVRPREPSPGALRDAGRNPPSSEVRGRPRYSLAGARLSPRSRKPGWSEAHCSQGRPAAAILAARGSPAGPARSVTGGRACRPAGPVTRARRRTTAALVPRGTPSARHQRPANGCCAPPGSWQASGDRPQPRPGLPGGHPQPAAPRRRSWPAPPAPAVPGHSCQRAWRPSKPSGSRYLLPGSSASRIPRPRSSTSSYQHYPDKRRGPLDHIGSDPLQTCPAASYSPTRSPAQYHRR